MTLLGLIVTLVVVGLVLWLINQFVPMDPKIKTILNVVVVIFLIVWLLAGSGLLSNTVLNTPIHTR